MRYDYTNGGIHEADIQKKAELLHEYRKVLVDGVDEKNYSIPEAALVAPFDTAHLYRAEEIARRIGVVRHLVLVGIGGSSRGTEAVYQALKKPDSPLLHVLDVIDASHVHGVCDLLSKTELHDFAIVIVSKSGTTTETIANTDLLLSKLFKVFGDDIYGRTVCVSDSSSPLQSYATKYGIETADIPETIGGRYSVFTAAGLVPLALLGFSVRNFVAGGAGVIAQADADHGVFTLAKIFHALMSSLLLPLENVVAGKAVEVQRKILCTNVPVMAASLHVLLAQKGTHTHLIFAQNPRLEGFGLWYQQLLAESLGKKITKGGEDAPSAMMPFCMTPRELHSTAQMYLSGAPVYTQFISAERSEKDQSISKDGFGSLLEIKGARSYARVGSAIQEGVRAAYIKASMPHTVYDIALLTEKSMGEAMAQKMLEVIYTAHLMNIDAFDQPHVELYKKETRTLLNT
jgi:glucose-6-phosphate isomerase